VQQHFSKVLISTSGAISGQTAEAWSGLVVTKTAAKTGRYTVTMTGGRRALLLAVNATLITADDAAIADASGIISSVRDDDMATDGTFELQWHRNTTLVDTEVADAAIGFFLMVAVAREA
jgi:hypothetical protein